MNKYLSFFLVLALSLGVLMWIVTKAKTEQILGTSSDVEIESLEKAIESL